MQDNNRYCSNVVKINYNIKNVTNINYEDKNIKDKPIIEDKFPTIIKEKEIIKKIKISNSTQKLLDKTLDKFFIKLQNS
jgi:hypothetical protein